MKRTLLLAVAGLFCINVMAQHAKISPNAQLYQPEKTRFTKSEEITAECVGLRKFQDVDTHWMRTVSSRRIEHGAPNKTALELRKAEKTHSKFEKPNREQNPEVANPLATDPTVGTNFLGNELFGGTPTDNTMGISNGGIIVSADNATMEVV